MKIKTIKIEKSRTILVEKIRGRDVWNKLTMQEDAILEDGDNEKEVREQISQNIEEFFAKEIARINNKPKDATKKF